MSNRVALTAFAILTVLLCGADEKKPGKKPEKKSVKIKHLEDETSLVRIKANPEKYVGQTFVLCGAVRISDYYNFSYSDAESLRYSLDFREAGDTLEETGAESCYLYLSKKAGKPIVDVLVKSAESKKSANAYVLTRVKATIAPAFFARDKQWDMMDVVDVQFADKENKWRPWMIEEAEKAERERAKARADAEKKDAQAKKEAAQKERDDKAAMLKAKREDPVERQKRAASKLTLAKKLLASKPTTGKKWLEDIVKQYPETAAGVEAADLLKNK